MTLLTSVLMNPAGVQELSPENWDLLIRQARHANLLGRLCRILEAIGEPPGILGAIPERPRNHLLSGATMADRQHASIRYEVGFLRETLSRQGIPLILLKGAAYVVAGLPASSGRVFADIDILVPRERLDDTESALAITGWMGTSQDAYDQRYYRRWMHELPAMQHMFRGTTLDVHHTILPPTSRLKPDAEILIRDSIEVPGMPDVRILNPCDMVLHSAAHLFHEGEPDNLLRDLSDLDLLLRHFGRCEDFWEQLTRRASLLDLDGPLGLALRYTSQLLGTPLATDKNHASRAAIKTGIRQRLLDAIYLRVLKPQHATCSDALSPLARKALYVRSHWLRMPPHLLAYHLAHKFLLPPKTKPIPLTDDAHGRQTADT